MPHAGALAALFPAKGHLASSTVIKYRELLRKLKHNANLDEGSFAFSQAKQRVLTRIQQSRAHARPDPLGAFHRLRHRLERARSSLSHLAQTPKQRLRHYLAALSMTQTDATGVSCGGAAAPPVRDAGDEAAAATAAVGGDGVLRVSLV